ncbi:MAG: hypothetical protein AAGC77_01145 [Pseudomonadota bacterium]
MKHATIAASAAALSFFCVPALAGQNVALGVQAGTLGVGADVQVRAYGPLVLRAGGHFLDFNIKAKYDGIRYDADFNLSNAYLTADVHPLNTGLFVSAGAIIGLDNIGLTATPANPLQVGDVVFNPADLGTVRGDVQANDVAPFLGVGFDDALTGIMPLSFSIMVGAAFTGEPDVALTAVDGLLEGDPMLEAELAREQANLQEDIDDYRIYPIARIGVAASF